MKGEKGCIKTMKQIIHLDLGYTVQWVRYYKQAVVTEVKNEISIDLFTNFGVKEVSIKVNGEDYKKYMFEGNSITLDYRINSYLNRGSLNEIEIYAKSYLGKEITKIYNFTLLTSDVSINFSSIASDVISSSRRILVNADAGIGKELDTDYCWYYWSTSPSDSLDYEAFLLNYAKSEYKGSYSENKGVILRNTAGTYYLYALAKDDNSTIVSRSEGYILDDTGFTVSYTINDAILIVSLLIVAIVPISIYLFVRKRGY